MSSYYGVVFPEFWTGRTGRELRQLGGKDAQVLGLYLVSSRHANMLGLYRLLVDDVVHETGLTVRAVDHGFVALGEADFASFDADASYVWVKQMCRFRLGLKSGEALDPNDKRVIAVNRIYHALDANPFLGDFYDLNHRILRIKKRRESVGVVVALGDTTTARASKGHTKGLISQIQRSEIRDQKQTLAAAAPPRTADAVENQATHKQLLSAVHAVLESHPDERHVGTVIELVKREVGRRHLQFAHTGEITSAVNAAVATRGRP